MMIQNAFDMVYWRKNYLNVEKELPELVITDKISNKKVT